MDFFELMNGVARRYGLLDLQMKKKPYSFSFRYCNHIVEFIYEKSFERGRECAWAVNSTPDFVVMEGEHIVGVFDAKNYSVVNTQNRTDATNKMLAYLTNLDANYGALFFPRYGYREFVYPSEGYSANYHFNLKLVHYKMTPTDSEDAIRTKEDMISKALSEIEYKIKSELSVVNNSIHKPVVN